ncbi:MAG: serine/threonine protein kinase [Pirellulales bacterium]|nr:serine/threonine protein kinase [Pirellulales bacterium]
MQVEKLGPYHIGKKIGKGGMGAVYEAVSEMPGELCGQRVAIKALSPQLATAEGFRERFEAEIDSLKKLDHPGIVRLYGYGEQDGILFYSMELVEGSSLEEEIKAGRRFDWRETLQIGIQVCRALKHAHDHGVVHRDIKPANLMLTTDKRVKIADFGIARLFGGTQLTIAGGVLGTADYMSPEQADGRAVTEKCDQYSLGGVLYAILAGRAPFRAKTMPEMLQMQRFAEPEPVGRYAPDTPKQLQQLLIQLLAKDPADRFPNVLVLSRHMEAMEKALSRSPEQPQANAAFIDDLATNPIPLEAEDLVDDLPTQADVSAPSALQGAQAREISLSLSDAPTLAKSEGTATEQLEQSEVVSTSSPAEAQAQSSTTRFTTVDEDARLQQVPARENRLALVLQLGSLVLALGVLIGGGWYLMRPASADELYSTIVAKIEEKGTEDLRMVAGELKQFLANFPADSRSEEIKDYQEKLDFQRFERRLRAKSRVRGGTGLTAVEKIYFQSMALAEDDPAAAAAQLRALVTLYDPQDETLAAQAKSPDSEQLLLIAARQQIDKLSVRAQQEEKSQLPALRERLAAAAKLKETDPVRARRMHQAVIRIYGEKSWAQSAVEEARAALKQVAGSE